jgi:hypothetical protein
MAGDHDLSTSAIRIDPADRIAGREPGMTVFRPEVPRMR